MQGLKNKRQEKKKKKGKKKPNRETFSIPFSLKMRDCTPYMKTTFAEVQQLRIQQSSCYGIH